MNQKDVTIELLRHELDKRDELERALRAKLELVVAALERWNRSCYPNPNQHPAMWAAKNNAEQVLAQIQTVVKIMRSKPREFWLYEDTCQKTAPDMKNDPNFIHVREVVADDPRLVRLDKSQLKKVIFKDGTESNFED